jgi:hypothetical protein
VLTIIHKQQPAGKLTHSHVCFIPR